MPIECLVLAGDTGTFFYPLNVIFSTVDQWLYPPKKFPPTLSECLDGSICSFGRQFRDIIVALVQKGTHLVYVVGVI